MKIESIDQDVRILLSSSYYRIPRFQRPYSWDQENIAEFWEDIVQENPGEYFIGSMVVYKDSKNYLDIVDGQQRLTTITILLCVLRDVFMDQMFSDLAEGVHSLIERKNIENKPEYILSTESSYPFFQDHIQKMGVPEISIEPLAEEINLQKAYTQLGNYVEGIVRSVEQDTTKNDEAKKIELEKKLKIIRNNILDLNLILIQLDNEDDAYLVFETLNTRGKDLSITDLVKNHLSKHIKPSNASIDSMKIIWEKMLETIQSSSSDINSDTFIHHYWLSKYEYLPSKRLFKSLKKQVKKEDAKDFLDSLEENAHYYRSIHEPTYGEWKSQESRIEEALNSFSLFKIKQQTPCVLSLVRSFRQDLIRKKHLEDALVAIEKFHFSFTAITSQRSSGGISHMYASLARRLHEKTERQDAVEIIKELKTKLKERIPSFDEFKALFPELIYTNNISKQRKLMKYVLIGFHRDLNKSLITDYDQMTIEHIFPQSKMTKEMNDSIVGQIGNLILIPHELNNKLDNKSFNQKKQILIKNGVKLPESISMAKKWDKKTIQNRTNLMAKKAYDEIWRIQ